MYKLITLNLILKLLDLLTTYLCINEYGHVVEGNPLMRGLFENIGSFAYPVSMIIFSLLMFIVYKKQFKGVAIISAIICFIAVVNNTIAYFM